MSWNPYQVTWHLSANQLTVTMGSQTQTVWIALPNFQDVSAIMAAVNSLLAFVTVGVSPVVATYGPTEPSQPDAPAVAAFVEMMERLIEAVKDNNREVADRLDGIETGIRLAVGE